MIRLLSAAWHLIALAVLGSYFIMMIRNLRWLRRLEDEAAASSPTPRISVLIPARNEADNLPWCLESLLQQSYPDFTVTVLDDHSTDATREIAGSYAARDDRVQVLDGTPLPDGWVGKPWACQQLAEQAEGDTLLFIDADTWFEPDALHYAAGLMQRERPGLLSLLAHQVTGTFAERLVIPGLYMVFLCNLPFWKIRDPDHPDIAVANGQFLCFDRAAYDAIGGHESVKGEIIEDLAIARVIKRSGHRLTARLALEAVHVRMYGSWQEVLDGFSKNAYNAIGERPGAAVVAVGMLLSTQVLPSAISLANLARGRRTLSGFWMPASEAALLILIRFLMSGAMRFRRRDAVLAPLTGCAGVVIILRSMLWRYRTGYQWKGRRIS